VEEWASAEVSSPPCRPAQLHLARKCLCVGVRIVVQKVVYVGELAAGCAVGAEDFKCIPSGRPEVIQRINGEGSVQTCVPANLNVIVLFPL